MTGRKSNEIKNTLSARGLVGAQKGPHVIKKNAGSTSLVGHSNLILQDFTAPTKRKINYL